MSGDDDKQKDSYKGEEAGKLTSSRKIKLVYHEVPEDHEVFFNLILLCVLRALRGDILFHYDPVAKSFSTTLFVKETRTVDTTEPPLYSVNQSVRTHSPPSPKSRNQ